MQAAEGVEGPPLRGGGPRGANGERRTRLARVAQILRGAIRVRETMGWPKGTTSWNVNEVFERDLRARTDSDGLAFLFRLLARHAWFVDPVISRAVGAVFPRTARGRLGSYRTGEVRGGISYWENQPPKYAFFAAIGSTERDFLNFNICHLWPGSTGDPRHFTRLANLVLVPRTLWRFTDWEPVEALLQRRSFELSGYQGPGKRPRPEPAAYPGEWAEPLGPEDPDVVIARLRHLRSANPLFKKLPGGATPRLRLPPPRPRDGRWASEDARPGFEPPVVGVKRAGARDLDAEAWAVWRSQRGTTAAFQAWVVRHAYFADRRVAAAVENPFPQCRRMRVGAGERQGQVVDGLTLTSNTPAADSLLVAIQKPIRTSLGGNVNHAWRDAPQLPAHFCNIRGLVLVPAALASLVDAEPIRALLKRQLFERTGYTGPQGRVPPKPAPFPREWPETIVLTVRQEDRAIRMLERYRRERPGYYRRARARRG